VGGHPADHFQIHPRSLGQVWQRLFRLRENGLSDETWVPLVCVDGRVVRYLLADLPRPACRPAASGSGRAGVSSWSPAVGACGSAAVPAGRQANEWQLFFLS
jgi:hypothetical protein